MMLALEIPRAGFDAASLASVWPLLLRAPKGDGHPVLVLPGLGASDLSTRVLRGFLRDRGYHVHAWRLGRNLGPRPATITGLRNRVAEVAERHGRKMSLVGWSLGGIYAREIGRSAPQVVRQVITLGSPFHLHDRTPLRVPATAIYTRGDGVVPWRSCLESTSATSESVEVVASHSGMGHNPGVLWVIADRLAQPEGGWRPFDAHGVIPVLLRARRVS
jgi:pimeloyl-ACP methyl ester carboxylesterase